MRKLALSIIVLVALLAALSLILLIPDERESGKLSFNSTSACLDEDCFKIQIADTPEKQEKGLMFVSSMPEDEGMLFVFDKQDLYSIWMKNTLIPLDIIWFDEDMNQVFEKENAEPCKTEPCEVFTPDKPAKYVLEVNAGMA